MRKYAFRLFGEPFSFKGLIPQAAEFIVLRAEQPGFPLTTLSVRSAQHFAGLNPKYSGMDPANRTTQAGIQLQDLALSDLLMTILCMHLACSNSYCVIHPFFSYLRPYLLYSRDYCGIATSVLVTA